MSRQIGKIRVSAGLIENRDMRVLDMFKSIEFMPIAIDSLNFYDEYVFTGYSSHFQHLNIEEQIPYYRINLEKATVTRDL